MNLLENFIKKQDEVEALKKELCNYLIELKKKYPHYLYSIDKDIVINNIVVKKSLIPTIVFYNIEIISYGFVSYINIPSNINYIKTLEYNILRTTLLSKIDILEKRRTKNENNKSFYDEIVVDVKYLKKNYKNMYKKEVNTFKDKISLLYSIKDEGI